MIIGRKNPNSPETAGGSTPEMKENDFGDALAHVCRKGTYARSYKRVRESAIEDDG
jgi:hypothetical protein